MNSNRDKQIYCVNSIAVEGNIFVDFRDERNPI